MVPGVVLLALAMQVAVSWANHRVAEDRYGGLKLSREILRQLSAGTGSLGQQQMSEEERTEAIGDLTEIVEQDEMRVRDFQKVLGPKVSHRVSLSFLGTVPTVFVAIFLTASLFGAEFRWGYWRVLALQAPRTRVMATKLLVMVSVLSSVILLALVFSYLVNALLARIYKIEVLGGWPSFVDLAGWYGRALLTVCAYAGLTALVVVLSGSALAGAGGITGYILFDSFVAERLSFLREISMAQQVANLFGKSPDVVGMTSRAWTIRPEDLFHPERLTVHKPIVFLSIAILISVIGCIISIRKKEL